MNYLKLGMLVSIHIEFTLKTYWQLVSYLETMFTTLIGYVQPFLGIHWKILMFFNVLKDNGALSPSSFFFFGIQMKDLED
jgi:hypothetical protein